MLILRLPTGAWGPIDDVELGLNTRPPDTGNSYICWNAPSGAGCRYAGTAGSSQRELFP